MGAPRGAQGAPSLSEWDDRWQVDDMQIRATLTALIFLLGAAQAVAQQAAAPADVRAAEYEARRDSLLARLGDGAAVVAFGERAPIGFPAFYQVPTFRYLTGFLEPDAALLLVRRGGTTSAILFREPRSARDASARAFGSDSFVLARFSSGNLSRRELADKIARNPNITRSDVRFLDGVAGDRLLYAATAQRPGDVIAGGRKFGNATINGTQAALLAIRNIDLDTGRFQGALHRLDGSLLENVTGLKTGHRARRDIRPVGQISDTPLQGDACHAALCGRDHGNAPFDA